MYKLKEFLSLMEEYAPLNLSYKMIERGEYDNSGIIVENHDQVKKVLFSLDLSEKTVLNAIEKDCDTIVTHHPAIYAPIKNLSAFGATKALVTAIKNNLNVISMHLNLDVAEKGIDECMATSLGAKERLVLDCVLDGLGYGRKFDIDEISMHDFKEKIKENLKTDKIICYGNSPVKKVASFCGAGGSHAVSVAQDGVLGIDTIVTSDLAHHQILAMVESGLNVVIIPHYVAEDYGFNKFYESILEKAKGKVQSYYFQDKRFM